MKGKRNEYDSQTKEIDSEVTTLLDKLDPLNSELANLQASHKHLEMQSEFHMNELKELGYMEVLKVTEEEVEAAETILPTLKKELADYRWRERTCRLPIRGSEGQLQTSGLENL